ncbi:V-type ATP synthase subunit D [Candidatus Woesearchaeota archaeon]|nr:V-type ATP synthase subunit D [Candidatus Woesearchaeota archaeon]
MNVKPTRMELLKIRKKLKLAQKGHKLLKQKRDALVIEFFRMLKGIKKDREQLAAQLTSAQKALRMAEAMQGSHDVERFVIGIPPTGQISVTKKSIMGVELPEIQEIKVSNDWFGYFESSLELDSAVVQYRDLVPVLLKLSEKQLALKRLGEEIGRTKRKVNALEYIIMPRIEKTKIGIVFKLAERERENFTRLKKIKMRRAA